MGKSTINGHFQWENHHVKLPEGTLAALWNWMALASWHPTVFCTTLAVLRNAAESWEALQNSFAFTVLVEGFNDLLYIIIVFHPPKKR